MNVKISPFSANGKICAAASKSYAHRFLIAAALCVMSYVFSLWRACRRERKAYLMDAKR